MVKPFAIPQAFLSLSTRLGGDPLQIQGPGGNTSIKREDVMWIKASGTELADARTGDIFVAVDVDRAQAEIDGAGDGTCRAAMLDQSSAIRPSIETTFHALFEQFFHVFAGGLAVDAARGAFTVMDFACLLREFLSHIVGVLRDRIAYLAQLAEHFAVRGL